MERAGDHARDGCSAWHSPAMDIAPGPACLLSGPDPAWGCFFANAAFEYSVRPGAVRDRIAAAFAAWMQLLEWLAEDAIHSGEMVAGTDSRQLAYEIEALGITAVLQSRLLAPDPAYALSRRAVLVRLRALCTDPNLLTED